MVKKTSVAILRKSTENKLRKKLTGQAKEVKKTLTLFGEEAPRIQELLIAKDSDNAIILTQRHLLRTLIDIIPLAEKQVRASDSVRGVYALNTLISQTRELITDIQATRDQQYLARNIVDNIIRPSFMDIAQFMINANYQLKKSIDDKLKPSYKRDVSVTIDGNAKDIAEYMQTVFTLLANRIEKEFTE